MTGLFLFPFLAAVITLPYIAFQYRKYGSVSKYKTMIIYSFVLYLLISYLMVILPLPSLESTVGNKWQEHLNLIPCKQIWNYWHTRTFNLKEIAAYMKSFALWQLLFNVMLTMPFGIYLRYYFKQNFLRTTLYSFCLSFLFEFTQITAIFGIYPGPYRLADVEDLICNTLGGVIGYQIAYVFIKFLPDRNSINERCISRQMQISGLRRFWAAFFDVLCCYFCFMFVTGIFEYAFPELTENYKDFIAFFFWTAVYIIELVQVLITGGGTLGHALCRMMLVSEDGSKAKRTSLVLRYFLLWLFTDFPTLAAAGLPHLFKDIPCVIIIALKVVSVAYIVVYMVNSIFRKKSFVMPHDKFSKTFYSAIAVKGYGEG